jgi:tetratricopeptide (TPR) repeat protein
MEEVVKKTLFAVSLCYLSLSVSSGWAIDAAALFTQGQQFENEQRWSEAFSTYSEILKYEPNNALAHYRLGTISEKLGAIDSAVRSYQEALRLDPNLGEARKALEGYYVNQGVMLRRNNQLDDAVRMFQQAITLNPSSANAHFELGQVFEQRGQTHEAIAEYQEAIKVDPDKSAAHARMAALYAGERQYENAAREYQDVLRLNPQDPAAFYGLGVAQNELGQKDQAIASLQQAVRFYLIAGQRDKARPAYDLQKKLMAEKGISSSPVPPRKK